MLVYVLCCVFGNLYSFCDELFILLTDMLQAWGVEKILLILHSTKASKNLSITFHWAERWFFSSFSKCANTELI